MMPSQSQSSYTAPDLASAWQSAQAAASFAATISVRCQAEGHGAERCLVRAVAEDGAARALAVARELHQLRNYSLANNRPGVAA